MDKHRTRKGDDEPPMDEDQQVISEVRAVQPDGPDSSTFWESFARRAGEVRSREGDREEALELTALALAISRGDLTLASYLRDLRINAGLNRTELGREVSLSPDLIGEIEVGRGYVAAIDPSRLARWAVTVGALKRAFIELVRSAVATPEPGTSTLPRLTRLDTTASRLESERAVRRTGSARPMDLEDFVSRVSDAFDAESSPRRRS